MYKRLEILQKTTSLFFAGHRRLVLCFLVGISFGVVIVGMKTFEIRKISRPLYQWVADFIESALDDYKVEEQLRVHPISVPMKLAKLSISGIDFIVPIVTVRLDSKINAEFMLDTGCNGIMVEDNMAQHFKKKSIKLNYMSEMGNGSFSSYVHFDTIALGSMVLHNKIALVKPANTMPVSFYPIDGVLGASFLHNRCFTLDYKNRCITFVSSYRTKAQVQTNSFVAVKNECSTILDDFTPALVGPFPYIKGELNGEEKIFLLDTGSPYNITANKIRRGYGSMEAKQFKLLKVGSQTLENLTFFDLECPDLCWVLGTPFLKDFNIYFDYANKRVFIDSTNNKEAISK